MKRILFGPKKPKPNQIKKIKEKGGGVKYHFRP